MNETMNRSYSAIVTVMSVLLVGAIITFLLASLLHLGIGLPLGFREPRIIPAPIGEGFCGLVLKVGAYALFARKTWAWRAVLVTHLLAIAAVLLGITALGLGAGPRTEANTIYHSIILMVLVIDLAGLSTRSAQSALGRHQQVL
ncbi:MAG: hypothetical protein ACJ788_26520 [Ktedonobacteraceae bacterium]